MPEYPKQPEVPREGSHVVRFANRWDAFTDEEMLGLSAAVAAAYSEGLGDFDPTSQLWIEMRMECEQRGLASQLWTLPVEAEEVVDADA